MKNLWKFRILLTAGLFSLAFINGEIFAQVPPTTTTFPDGKNTVEIPFTRYRNWIIVQVNVNDKQTLSFILDTGAPIALLADKDSAEPLGLNILGQAMVAGGDGRPPQPVPLARGVKFTLGELQIENCVVAVGAASEVISGVDGVIGKYVFENSIVAIDWIANKLVITKPEAFQYKGTGETVPFKMANSGHIYTEVTLEKNGKKKTLKAAIDTGNRSTFKMNNLEPGEIYTDGEALKNLISGWGANGPDYGDVTRVDVALGSFRFSDVAASSKTGNGRLERDGITGNIGLSILERFNLIFDFQKGRLILEKNENFDQPFFYNQSGILLHPKREPEFVRVSGIIPGSSAAENGLMADDQIVGINGKQVKEYQTEEIDALLSGQKEKEIEVLIKRREEEVKRKIVMKKLI